jgi:O-antigen/teichoic acid export membrane protein
VIFAIQAAQAGSFLALAIVLMPEMGITGAGAAFLLGQSAVALVAFAIQIVPLLRDGRPASATPDGTGSLLQDAR